MNAVAPVYSDTPLRQVRSVAELLNNGPMRKSLAAVASKHLTPERLMKLVAKAISSTPKLAECEPMSMYRGLMTCVELNLEPNSPMGHIYLIPFWNGRAKRLEVQTIVGYKGFLALAHRHPSVISAHADVVFGDDTAWEFSYGSGGGLKHVPGPRQGPVLGAYMYAKLRDGGEAYRFLTAAEIIATRDRTNGWKDAVKKGKTETSPWFTHENAMFRKTAVRALANSGELPMSAEFADAIDADYEAVEAPIDFSGAIEGAIAESEHDADGVVTEADPAPAQIENKPAAPIMQTSDPRAAQFTKDEVAALSKAPPIEPNKIVAPAPASALADMQAKAKAAAAARKAPAEDAPAAAAETAVSSPAGDDPDFAEVEDGRPDFSGLAERIWDDVEAMPPAQAFEACEIWQDQLDAWQAQDPEGHAAFLDKIAERESEGR